MDTVCTTLAFIDGLGAPEMVLIFIVVLVLFGGQKLPEFARGLGKSIREFKKAAAGVEEEFKRALEEDERKNATPKLTPPAHSVAAPDPTQSPGPGYESPGYDEYSGVTDDTPAKETPTTPAAVPTAVAAPAPAGNSPETNSPPPASTAGAAVTPPTAPTPPTPLAPTAPAPAPTGSQTDRP